MSKTMLLKMTIFLFADFKKYWYENDELLTYHKYVFLGSKLSVMHFKENRN